MSGDPNDLLTVPEIAAILRFGPRKVLQLLADGKIPGRKDYRWTARRADVLAYHDRNVVEVRPNKRRGRGRRAA
jgi:hypothetical protein